MNCHALVLACYIFVILALVGCDFAKDCPKQDDSCGKDEDGYNAIAQLHSQIDDDHDGGLNRNESDEFIKEDLKDDDGLSRRNFHGNDDFITVYDLWRLWVTSEVYNWTTDEVINWLTVHVELPQYADNFRSKSVDGHLLPRLAIQRSVMFSGSQCMLLASNSQSFATSLGIKNAVHKQKLAIKATDLVLFGPSKSSHNYLKDALVVLSLLVGAISAFLAYKHHNEALNLHQKVNKDLCDLQHAEDALRLVQQDLEKAQKDQQTIADDKLNLEKRLQDEIKLAKEEAEKLKLQRNPSNESCEIKMAEEELMQVRLALCHAERRLEENHCLPLLELQHWLQLSYEIETKYFEAKREATEKQLKAAKEMCEKIRKQKGKFLGAFRVAHTTSLDETDNKIMNVRASLEDVKMDLQERTQRWQHIEDICQFNIISNPGISYLEAQLKRPDKNNSRNHVGHLNIDDADESMPSTMLAQSLHPPSMSDLSFRTCSSAAINNSPLNSRKATRPLTALKSKHSKTQLYETGSEESLDRPTEKAPVFFNLGDESALKQNSTTFSLEEKPLTSTSTMQAAPTAMTTDQTQKSNSSTTMTDKQNRSSPSRSQTLPDSLSDVLLNRGSNDTLNSDSQESEATNEGNDITSRSLDDGNISDPLNMGQESGGKDKKKKTFGIFKRPKVPKN